MEFKKNQLKGDNIEKYVEKKLHIKIKKVNGKN
jgi:hypothetical protein